MKYTIQEGINAGDGFIVENIIKTDDEYVVFEKVFGCHLPGSLSIKEAINKFKHTEENPFTMIISGNRQLGKRLRLYVNEPMQSMDKEMLNALQDIA